MEIMASSGVQLHRNMKKRKTVFAMSSALDDRILQLAERCKPRRKKQKVREIEEEEVATAAPILEPLQIVENHEAASGGESHEKKTRKKKKKKKKMKMKMKMEEVAAVSSTLSDPILQLAERCGPRRKKHKTRKMKEEEGTDMAHTLEPVQIVESHEAASCGEPLEKEERRKKKMKMEDVPNAPLALDLLQFTESHKKKRKKKETVSNGLVYGKYSAEEDAALKQAIFDFIREKGWEREDGIHRIIHSKSGESLGCWPTIGKCLPHREPMGLYARAHKLLGVRFGKWSSAEVETLKELHRVHGNQWTKISKVIGRDRSACCLKWHNSVKWSTSLNQKTEGSFRQRSGNSRT